MQQRWKGPEIPHGSLDRAPAFNAIHACRTLRFENVSQKLNGWLPPSLSFNHSGDQEAQQEIAGSFPLPSGKAIKSHRFFSLSPESNSISSTAHLSHLPLSSLSTRWGRDACMWVGARAHTGTHTEVAQFPNWSYREKHDYPSIIKKYTTVLTLTIYKTQLLLPCNIIILGLQFI